jgi:hypothetical protein
MSAFEAPLNLRAAAAFVGLHPETLRRLAKARKVKAHHPTPRHLRFWKTDLINFIDGVRT